MTTPKIATVKRGNSRYYIHPTTGNKMPGVTSVIGMAAKPFLQYWASKLVAEAAVDHAGSWIGMALNGDRDGAVDYLKRAPGRFTRVASDRGTEAHAIWEEMSKPKGNIGRVHPDMQWAVDGYSEFLDAFEPEFDPDFLEATVFEPGDVDGVGSYAGSFDAMARIGDELVILDNKSGKGVYPEVGLQLNAYAAAKNILLPSGETIEMPQADAAAVFHCHPGKPWALVPIALDRERYMQVFNALLVVFDWDKVGSKSVIGNDVNPVAFRAEQGRA